MHSVFSRLLRKFPDSARTLRRTQTLTTVGLFLAIQMVLSSYGVIQLNDSLKISLAHLALAHGAREGDEGDIEQQCADKEREQGKFLLSVIAPHYGRKRLELY